MGAGRVFAFVLGSAVISVVSVIGILIGFSANAAGFAELGILYFSAFSYSLMATSYFFYSRRLDAATWFAPLWFLAHSAALILILAKLNRSEPVALPVETETRPTGQVSTPRN
jgi:uncharacterized membrane protein